MRVLLFVQHGDARPKVAWTGASARRIAACYQRDAFRNHMARDKRSVDFIPPWWLVECENADAGRAVIADVEHGKRIEAKVEGFYRGPASYQGRVLASGGKGGAA